MKIGEVVTIYEDPITENIQEAKAKLLKRIDDAAHGLEIWQVKFINDGMIVIRWIKSKATNQKGGDCHRSGHTSPVQVI